MELSMIVDIYKKRIRPKLERELSWYARQPDLETAIDRASQAINSQGKKYKHQWRTPKVALSEAREVLVASRESIQECESYEELHDLIDELVGGIYGIGVLYVYDTALRIGAYLSLMPTRIYLHRGTRKGAKNLGLQSRGETLSMSDVSHQFKSLYPHEVEDILCIFKDKFKATDSSVNSEALCNRSVCS